MNKIHFTPIIIVFILLTACTPKKGKSDIELVFTPDTLQVGYTYWWPESGPFIGECGTEISFAFYGTITAIDPPTKAAGPLYTSQEGIVENENVFKIKDLGVHKYTNQNFFKTDCFNGLNLAVGDKVLVTCYDYNDQLSIPGHKSILKVSSIDDPIVQSFKKYINHDQNPKKIKKDTLVWKNYELGDALSRQLKCK